MEWQDMVAPDAERFLSTVQQYVRAILVHHNIRTIISTLLPSQVPFARNRPANLHLRKMSAEQQSARWRPVARFAIATERLRWPRSEQSKNWHEGLDVGLMLSST
jgi:hypothetical protein